MHAPAFSVSSDTFAVGSGAKWHQIKREPQSLATYPMVSRQVVGFLKPLYSALNFIQSEESDFAVAPGRAATAEWLHRVLERRSLEDTIDSLVRQNAGDDSQSISDATRAMAKCFLKNLPESVLLPRISPDGEMGLHLYWSGDSEKVVTVDDFYLHGVNRAGTLQATYVDDVLYDGGALPKVLIKLFNWA